VSCLALFQTTLHRKCHPYVLPGSVLPAPGLSCPVGVGPLLDAEPEGDVLVVGEACVVVGEAGALVVVCTGMLPVTVTLGDTVGRGLFVGLPDLVALDVCVPDTRLVPGSVLPAELAGTEAVTGPASRLADAVGDPEAVRSRLAAPGLLPSDNSTATIAMRTHAATPPTASHRVRRRLPP
jgi:hypothetical protein